MVVWRGIPLRSAFCYSEMVSAGGCTWHGSCRLSLSWRCLRSRLACSSSSSSTSAAAPGTGTATAVAAGTCPTSNTVKFAKTKFVADAALAGGAFKRYIYTPAKDGKLKKGASGRVLALVKAAAAGAFVINRLKAAETAAQGNPTLCKVFVAPAAEVHGRPDRAGRQGQERRHQPVGRRRRLERADRRARRGHLRRRRLHRQRQRQHHRLTPASRSPAVRRSFSGRPRALRPGAVPSPWCRRGGCCVPSTRR